MHLNRRLVLGALSLASHVAAQTIVVDGEEVGMTLRIRCPFLEVTY